MKMSEKIKQQEPETGMAPAEEKQAHEPPMNAKEELNEFFKTAVIAVLLAVLIRSFFL